MFSVVKKLFKSKFFQNSSFLIVGKFVTMMISLLVSILSARFLGPKNFGIVNYASSIVTFFIPICDLGIGSVITYFLVNYSQDEHKVLGTAIVMQFISGLLCIIGAILSAFVLNLNDTEIVIVVGLYSIELIFKSFEIISYWFQVHYISKCQAISGIIVYALVAGYKFLLLFAGASIRWFALSMTLDYLLTAIVYLFLYFKNGGKKLAFSFPYVKMIWISGSSFIIPGIMRVIFTQTDKIMLKSMISEDTVAFYSVSASMVAICGYVLLSVISAASPLIIEECKEDKSKTDQLFTSLYSLVIYICIAFILFSNLIIKEFIHIFYSDQYIDCIMTFRILSIGTIFTYLGVAKSIWFIVTNKQKYAKWLAGIGAAVNVVLNYFLIIKIGLEGAAIATVFTEMTVNFLAGFFFKDIAHNSFLMIKALNPINIVKMKYLLTK